MTKEHIYLVIGVSSPCCQAPVWRTSGWFRFCGKCLTEVILPQPPRGD